MVKRSISHSGTVAAASHEHKEPLSGTTSFAQKVRLYVSRPWFAYLTLFLLQLKMIWGIWEYRDLTPGDTSFYYKDSYLWYKEFLVNITYSPLYTVFYGTLMHLSSDAYLVTTLHRLIIILSLAVLVLACMRRLLPASLAWFAAAWWVILPTNYNALYEIHLFSVIPVIVIWLFALRKTTSWTRSITLAMLFLVSILVRNELIVSTVILGLICLIYELQILRRQRRSGEPTLGAWNYVKVYCTPWIIVAIIVLLCYERSTIKFPELITANAKHTFNMCQVYAFGYQERHPEWKNSPWTECFGLMQSEFGKPLPTLAEMFKSNPKAVLEHFWWNISLAPNGLQILIFNATWDPRNPDYIEYIPLNYHSLSALILTIIVIVTLAIGLFLLHRKRRFWWQSWLRERAFGWLVMLSVIGVTFIIIPTQRPRPAYLFTLGLFIIALTAMCVFAIAERWPKLKQIAVVMPIVMLLIVVATPNHYAEWSRIRPRSMLEVYRRLSPFQNIIARPSTVFLKGDWYLEVPNYVGLGASKALDYTILKAAPPDQPIQTFLAKQGVNLFYLEQPLLTTLEKDPRYDLLLHDPDAAGWKLIGSQDTPSARWKLFQKKPEFAEDPADLEALNVRDDIGPAADQQTLVNTHSLPPDGLFVGRNWYVLEAFGGETFRWVNNDAEIVVTAPTGNRRRLQLDLMAGPGLAGQTFNLQVLDPNGQIIAKADVQNRMPVTVTLPIAAGKTIIYRLHVVGGGQPAPKDPRTLNFRVFKFEWEAQ